MRIRRLVPGLLGLVFAAPLYGQSPTPVEGSASDDARGAERRNLVFAVTDPELGALLRRIDDRSPSWRSALDSVSAAGGRIVVTTVQDLADVPDQFARAELAAVSPVIAADSSVAAVLVVVNRELLDRLYALVPDAHPSAREMDLVRILVHEIYGHAVPYLLAGHARGACPDPVDARQLGCSVARENIIRAELSLQPRRAYDLTGLALARFLDL